MNIWELRFRKQQRFVVAVRRSMMTEQLPLVADEQARAALAVKQLGGRSTASAHLLLTPPAHKKSPAVPAEPSSPTVIHSLPRSGLVQQDFRTPVPPRKLLPSCSIRTCVIQLHHR